MYKYVLTCPPVFTCRVGDTLLDRLIIFYKAVRKQTKTFRESQVCSFLSRGVSGDCDLCIGCRYSSTLTKDMRIEDLS